MNEKKIDLIVSIDDALVLNSDNGAPVARLNPKIRLRNGHDDRWANLSADNLDFRLANESGDPIEKLAVNETEDFKMVEAGGEQVLECQLNVSHDVEPNKTYKLQVDAFGQTCTTEFEFA